MHSLSLDTRRCLTCCHAYNSDGVASRSSDHHGARHAHDAAHRRAEVGNRAPSGTANRANRTAPGTPNRAHRATRAAAYRTRRATRRARRHQHYPHRAKKVVGSFGPTTATGPPSAGPGRPYIGGRAPDLPGQRTQPDQTSRVVGSPDRSPNRHNPARRSSHKPAQTIHCTKIFGIFTGSHSAFAISALFRLHGTSDLGSYCQQS